jgi:hypothetical protein
VDVSLPQPGRLSSGAYEGDGFVTVRHAETPVVTAALRQLINGVRVELE